MAALYLKNLLLKFLSYSYDAGYCWEDLPSLCFGPGFPRSDFVFGSSTPIVTKVVKASRYEYGYLTLPTPTIPLPMTITMAPGALEFPYGGITKPGLADVISSPGDYFSTGQLQYLFLACMISMWIGLLVNRWGNYRRALESQAEIDRLAVAYRRLERESECRTKEQAERSERQKSRLLRTLHSRQLRLGTKSRAMRDRLTRRHQRSLSKAQNEATGLREALRKAQTKPTTINHNESSSVESDRNEAIERLSIENFNMQESNRQLNSEVCERKVKLGRVTRCLQDSLLHDRSAIVSKTHELSAADILGDDNTQTFPMDSSMNAATTARRSSVSGMEGLQGFGARQFVPHHRRSMSAAIPVSVADIHSSTTNSAESLSLREIVAFLRVLHGDSSSQPSQAGSSPPKDDDRGEETCWTASQSGDGLQAEDDEIGEPYYGQRPTVPKGRTKRRRRRAKGAKDVEAMDA